MAWVVVVGVLTTLVLISALGLRGERTGRVAAVARWIESSSSVTLAALFVWSAWAHDDLPRWETFADGACSCFFAFNALRGQQ
jgi:hypothetical protein